MTSRDEALMALEKRWNDLGDEIMQGAGDLPDDLEGRMTARLLRLQADTVDRCRSELAAILATASEQASVADERLCDFFADVGEVEQFMDDLCNVVTELTGDEGEDDPITVLRRYIDSPAHTSEARDAIDAARYRFIAADRSAAWEEELDAAMRQEGGSDAV